MLSRPQAHKVNSPCKTTDCVLDEMTSQVQQLGRLGKLKITLSFLKRLSKLHSRYPTLARFTRGLYFIYALQTVGISLKFVGVLLIWCGLYSREFYFRERVNLGCVQYAQFRN